MTLGILPLAGSPLAGPGSGSGGAGGVPGPSSVIDDLLRVLGRISTDRGDLSTVRYCTTRRFTASDLAGHQVPAIGVWEEDIQERFLAGHQRDVALTLRLYCLVQGSTEDRALELRDYLRRDINFRLFADQQRSGFAYQTDGESEWVLEYVDQVEGIVTLALERTMVIRSREYTLTSSGV